MSVIAAVRRNVARACSALLGQEEGLRILTYHRVNDDHPRDRLTVSSRSFAAQMAFLADSGVPVVSLTDVLPTLVAPAGAVAITFDDGYEDNHSVALPLLERYGFKACFFVVTGLLDSDRTLDRYEHCCRRDGFLRWDQVRQMKRSGHSIGAHSHTHRELPRLTAEEVRQELSRCADEVASAVGERPRVFCYPRGAETPAVREAVEAEGYEAACTVAPGPNRPGAPLFALRRTEVSGADSLADFKVKLQGGFDAWHRTVQALRAGHVP